MQEPSHTPCPLCGNTEEEDWINYRQREYQRNKQRISDLNAGFLICYFMTELQSDVFFNHQIKKLTFKDISEMFDRSEASIKNVWQRCKSKAHSTLQDSEY